MKDQSFFERINNWIKTSITLKIISIGIMILLLLIPGSMVKSIINERNYTRENAIEEVSGKWGNAQTIIGPIVTVPYKDFVKATNGKLVPTTLFAHFLPEQLNIDGKIFPETRYRGIYKVAVYKSKINFSGNFSMPKFNDWNISPTEILWKDAFVSIGIPDMRGIEKNIVLKWNNDSLPFNPGIDSKDVIVSGVSTKIPLNATDTLGKFNFSFDLNLNGSKELNFAPIGKETNLQLVSNWNSPSFTGAFLPDNRSIQNDGFKANWNILHLNRNYPQQWRGTDFNVDASVFGLSLLIPVDEYQKTSRSEKYSIMIISLTFLLFFFIEILNKKRIHPIQYLLVGLAIIIFYILLLSISEHLSFNFAYILGSIAVIGLIITYCFSIFNNNRLTILMGLILVILYGFVYIILQLEDYALLMGSIGLFIVLAIVMFLSRKINWYSLNE